MTNDVADGIVGVMRHAERFHEQVADLERTARGKQSPGNADFFLPFGIGGDGFGGETIGVDGQGTRFAQDAEAADVIGVFVGEDDAADLIDVAVDEREAVGDLAPAEAGIDEKPRRVGFDQGAITGAATTQNRDVHPHARYYTEDGLTQAFCNRNSAISGGQLNRTGGAIRPMPRLTYMCVSPRTNRPWAYFCPYCDGTWAGRRRG